MKSYYFSQNGMSTTTVTQPNGASSVSTNYKVVAYNRFLQTSANPGDFHHPTNQLFTGGSRRYINGSLYQNFNDGGRKSVIGEFGWSPDPGTGSLVAGFDSNVYNSCLSKVYDMARGNLDLSVDLLEADQVEGMVRKSLRSLRNLGSVVQKMRRSPSKVAADLWLEFTYGWRPLASSIYDTVHLFQKGPRTGFFRVSATSRSQISKTINGTNSDGRPRRTVAKGSYRCRMSFDVSVKPSVLANLSSMTSLNPASIAWELMPYSFVIDWFVDIGGYLRNMESACLYASAFNSGYATEGYLVEYDTIVYGVYNGGTFITFGTATGSSRYFGKRRTAFAGAPWPRPPRLKLDLGSSRLLSAASLLRQQLG